MDAMGWTLDELAARVAEVLDGPAYPGAPNGRVRDVPDARAIRWYSTIGLVDRPSGMRGRTALYGPRHLLQLVAVKRRQAQGLRLADIQAELSGAPDDQLRRIAELPPAGRVPKLPPAAESPQPDSSTPVRDKFWGERPVGVTITPEYHGPSDPVRLGGVHLDGGAMLLLPEVPRREDVTAILAASRPLIEVLTARGLIHANEPVLSADTTE
jgi:DNA-binding transcriptional MerR regulator